MQFVNTALGGLTLGMVYAAFALALVMIWRSTRIVNFAQAPMAMLTTFIALSLIEAGHSWWLGFAAALLSGLVLGAVLERVVVRPVEGKSEINAVILTLGLFVVLHAVAAVIFGNRFRSFPAPFGIRGFEVGDRTIGLTGFGVFTILVGAAHDGSAGRPVQVHRPRAADARLGVQPGGGPDARRTGRPHAHPRLGPGSLVGSLSGLLIAGGNLVHPGYMDSVVVFGFVAAVLGGLDSPIGAVIGGLLLGLSLSFVSGYIGSQLVPWRRSGILMVVLILRPSGLLGPGRGPEGLMRERVRRWADVTLARHLAVAALGLVVVTVVLTAVSDFRALQLAEMAYLGTAAAGLTVLTGLNGQISLGHGALMAFGAYTTALLLPDREARHPWSSSCSPPCS